jgi:hypothetical protein
VKDNNPRMDNDIERWLREANRCCDSSFEDEDEVVSCNYKKLKEEDDDESEEKSS